MFFAKKIALADGGFCSKYPELLESIFEGEDAAPNSKNITRRAPSFALEDIPHSEEIPPLECVDGRSLFAGWSAARPMGLAATHALAKHLQAFRSVKISELDLPARKLFLEKIVAAQPGGHFEDCYKLTEFTFNAESERARQPSAPGVFTRAGASCLAKELSMSEPYYALFKYRGHVVVFGRKRILVLNDDSEYDDENGDFDLRDCHIYADAFYAAIVDRSATSVARWGDETLVCVYKTSPDISIARFGDLHKAKGELIHFPLRDPERKSESSRVLSDFELPEIEEYLNDNEDKFAGGGFPQSLPYYAVDSAGHVWIQGTRELRVYSPAFDLLAAAPLAADAEGLAIYPAANGDVHIYIPDEEGEGAGGDGCA